MSDVQTEVEVALQAMDRSTVEAILRAYYLSEFMSDCIVEDKYKPPVTFATPIVLTSRGKSLAGQVKRDGVTLFEAQLATFLTMWAGADLLIDPLACDLDALRLNISSEMKRGKLKYPWIYGRKLYDAMAVSSFHGAYHLGQTDTAALLKELPMGVFQLGPYVGGPYGLIESKTWRSIPPAIDVPGQHCHEVDCDKVHRVQLSTAETGVSKARSAINQKLSKLPTKEAKVFEEILEVQNEKIPIFSWAESGALPFFLFECLTLDDVRRLLVELFYMTKGQLRGECQQLDLVVTDARAFVATLSDAQLLQIILLADDSVIHECLNRLVWNEEIRIASGELRSTKIVRGGFGGLNIAIQASHLGVRHQPPVALVPVRLRQLINSCFPIDGSGTEDRIKWSLRAYEGDTAAAKLTNALSVEAPAALVKKLVVTEESTYRSALAALGLPADVFHNSTDDEIADLVTWHLGFESPKRDVELNKLFGHIASLKKLIGSLPTAFIDSADVSRIRQVSSDLFVSLEDVLKRTLCFVTWFAIRDHYAESYDLVYSKGEAKEFFVDWKSSQDPDFTNETFDKMALDRILGCFGLVAKFMRQSIASAHSFRRDVGDWPRALRDPASPFRFPFEHRLPLLDLDTAAARFIADLVGRIPASMQAAGVQDIRNGFLHHRDEVPDTARIGTAIEAIDARLSEIVGNGLYPIVYSMENSSADYMGRRRIELDGAVGPRVVLTRPSPLDVSGFPSVTDPQIIVIRATLRDSGEPLRFGFRLDSDYTERWKRFPRRPVKNRLLTLNTGGEPG